VQRPPEPAAFLIKTVGLTIGWRSMLVEGGRFESAASDIVVRLRRSVRSEDIDESTFEPEID